MFYKFDFSVSKKKEISKIYEDEKKKLELDEYTRRLTISKKKLHSVQATIMSVQVQKSIILTVFTWY